jgi:hypothetical protein
MSTALPATVEIRAHIDFLRAVHSAEEDLYRGPSLVASAERYVAWLRDAAADGGSVITAPLSLTEAWCWHCHRLAPLKYLSDCRAMGGSVVPARGVGFEWAVATPSRDNRQALTEEQVQDHDKLVSDIVARAGRQSTFLWQISGDAYADKTFLTAAVARYEKFLSLVNQASARHAGALAPPLDVDLVWHTHILCGDVAEYAAETARWCGGNPLDHDDNAPDVDGMWNNTQSLWEDNTVATVAGTDVDIDRDHLVLDRAVRPGAHRRPDPPAWWFDTAAPTVVVKDDFLSQSELGAILAQMPSPDDAVTGGNGAARGQGFGKDARCTVNVTRALERRIQECVASELGMIPPDRDLTVRTVPGNGPAAGDDPSTGTERTRLPARVAVGHMHAHRDRLAVAVDDGSGAMLGTYADGYVAVVYMRGGGSLVLEADPTAGAWIPSAVAAALDGLEIDIVPGRLIAFPNFGVLHSGRPAKSIVGAEGDEASVCDDAAGVPARYILGPVALVPGRARLTQAGDCGGGASAPRKPAPYPPTSSSVPAEGHAGRFTKCCFPCVHVQLTEAGPDELRATGICFIPPFPIPGCICCHYYLRESDDGDFTMNGGSSCGRMRFSDDNLSVDWAWCCFDKCFGSLRRRGSPPQL